MCRHAATLMQGSGVGISQAVGYAAPSLQGIVITAPMASNLLVAIHFSGNRRPGNASDAGGR